MKRKVIKLAENTFVISLPSSFIKRYNLGKGDVLDTELLDDKFIIYTSKSETAGEISVDIQKLDKKVIRWLLSAIYKKGYDGVSIKLDESQRDFVVNELKEYIGFSILEEKDNLLTVKSIIKENKEDIHNVLRRAFRVTIKMARDLSSLIKNDLSKNISSKKNLSKHNLSKYLIDIRKLEFENNQLVNFCERIINKKSDLQAKEKTFYYVIVWNLEKICDNFKYICDDIEQDAQPPSKQEIGIFDEINSLLDSYYALFYNFNIEKMNALVIKINELKNEIKKIKNPSASLLHLSLCLQQIADLSSSYIGINIR